MRTRLLAIILVLFWANANAQIKLTGANAPNRGNVNDSTDVKRSKGFKDLATIDMYLQYNTEADTSIVDTTLTIKKDYKFNYLQKALGLRLEKSQHFVS